MAVILSINSRRYNPQTVTRSFAVPAGNAWLKISFTREAWPAGPVGSISFTRPDGTFGGSATFSGGDIPTRDGTGVQTTTTLQVPTPQSGSYSFTAVLTVAIDTAITVERG